MRSKLIKSLKPRSRAILLLLATFVATAFIDTRRTAAQECPFDPCNGDPCCGVENCNPSAAACQLAGWLFNFSNGVCENPPFSSQQCDDIGMFWNFTSNVCQDDPPTQVTCDIFDAFWDFTNSRCGSEPAIGNCGGGGDWGNYFSTGCYSGLGIFSGLCGRSNAFISQCYRFDGDYDSRRCVCTGCDSCGGSPILIDVPGGFNLTDVNRGVRFDLNANGTADRLSWTAPDSTAAWLVLDRNRSGAIENGKELFGNFTFQTEPETGVERNGFLALAEYDKPENGGNGDRAIDSRDAVFLKLRLWRDLNHNGISDPGESQGLWEFGIESMSLNYKQSKRRDQYGNEFRYRAKIYGAKHVELARWAYDVYLLSAQ